MEENKFTPGTIKDYRFSIPLYQRLFEWEEKQINQLLNDLYDSFKQTPTSPYYIGMFTVYKNNDIYDLVDGQQRFTVLILMAIALKWKKFYFIDGKLRLTFFARKNDEEYLEKRIKSESYEYTNIKMEAGINTINAFFEKIEKEEDRKNFDNYIFNHTTFFISELPDTYKTAELNRHFEAMNATGKALENHEILKVKLLKELPDRKELFTKVWNAVSQMNKSLIRSKEGENTENYRKRFISAIKETKVEEKLKICNDFYNKKENSNNEEYKTIAEIKASSQPPKQQLYIQGERAIMNFSQFLLQVLWLQLTDEEKNKTNDFFNTQKLQRTFEKHLKKEKISSFMEALLKYRLLFDYFIIRINSQNESSDTTYSLNFYDKSETHNKKDNLIHYQSMLYVSTSNYLWLTPFLKNLENNFENINYETLLNELKTWDNSRYKVENISLKYDKIDRYWFWRLDYYLWENRKEYFKEEDKQLEIVDNYVFKANRSIEHIAPQTPKEDSVVKIDAEYKDNFGNLAMISSGQNSSLKNASFEIKRAHVLSFINKDKYGTIESLKMLKIYEYKDWNNENLIIHHNKMIEILKKSFPDENATIQNKLEELKFPTDNKKTQVSHISKHCF